MESITSDQQTDGVLSLDVFSNAKGMFNSTNEMRLWLGRQVEVLANAIHPKTVFFPLKIVEKTFALGKTYLEGYLPSFLLQGQSSCGPGCRGDHNFTFQQVRPAVRFIGGLPIRPIRSGNGHTLLLRIISKVDAYIQKFSLWASIPQALFAITGLSGLLNLKKEDFVIGDAKVHDHHHDDHHHDHHLEPFEKSHRENVKSMKLLKGISNTLDYTSGLFNCGLASLVSKVGFATISSSMHRINSQLTFYRNITSFVTHAAISMKDIGSSFHTFSKKGTPSRESLGVLVNNLKETLWKDGVPLVRFGGALVRPLALMTGTLVMGPSAIALAELLSFSMGFIQVFSGDFKGDEAGGGCC